MRSSSETGHAKNVANFEKLISYAREMGAVYRPSNENLNIAALEALAAKARQTLGKAVQTKLKYDDAVIDRNTCFRDLTNLSSRIINYLISSGVSAAKVEDARAFSRKLSGQRAGAKDNASASATNAANPAPRTVSVSQMSFDSKADFFGKLIALATEEKAYQPQEADLLPEALALKLKTLYDCNQKTTQATQQWRMSLDERDNALYTGTSCLFDCAALTKAYLKAVGGPSSPLFKGVSKLKFVRPRN